ncbi:DUF305 domain-containing protein [Georgenia wangjunii]|uniref:DUF305 domain-containing protein n=1 Tax=Georgenia wangjunii TaxID=3117730 RepID=UPI002F263624
MRCRSPTPPRGTASWTSARRSRCSCAPDTPEFDRRFPELMIMHHEGAVEMAQSELDAGQNPQARELAQKIIVDQEVEIEEMEQMPADL